MAPVGGLRHRLIWDSLYDVIKDGLTSLDWFVTSDSHAPIYMIAEPWENLLEVPKNTLTVTTEGTEETPAELGSMFTEHQMTFFVDFFAENDTIGVHMINDVKDIIEGRMPSIGRTQPNFYVYDTYSAATPTALFSCEITDVQIDRGRVSRETWKSSWFACSFIVIDYYADENG